MSKIHARSFYRPHQRVTFDNLQLDRKTGELVPMPSMTKQSFVAECDINNILKQFSTTGILTHVKSQLAAGTYQDLPDEIDFQQSVNTIKAAETAFMTLPAKVRREFGDEPAAFLEFLGHLDDPATRARAVELGLVKRPPPASAPDPSPDKAPKAAGKAEKAPPAE